jgi:glucose 1-dehydrogenase
LPHGERATLQRLTRGGATALKFTREGAKIVAAELNEESGRGVVEEIRDVGGDAMFDKTDVSRVEEVKKAVGVGVEEYHSLDVMFNNAGIGGYAPFLEQEPDAYAKVVRVNQYGVFYGIRAAGRKMRDLGARRAIIKTSP